MRWSCGDHSRATRQRVVLGRFIRTPEQLIRLRLAGRDPPVEVTASHVLFSADRGDWAAAGDLAVGESIETLAGPARIEAIELADSRPLATLMVESEHLYIATEQGVLSENCGGRLARGFKPRGEFRKFSNRRDAKRAAQNYPGSNTKPIFEWHHRHDPKQFPHYHPARWDPKRKIPVRIEEAPHFIFPRY